MFTSSWILFMTSKTHRTLEEQNTSLAKKKCQYSYQLVFLKLEAISSSHAFFHMFLYLKNEKCLFQTEFSNDMYGIYRIASVILKLKFLYISEQSSFYILRFLQRYATRIPLGGILFIQNVFSRKIPQAFSYMDILIY